MTALTPPPLSVYVHMPWCVQKCPYCDFNSHAAPEILPEDRYIAHLIDDLEHDCSFLIERPVETIFFGGGTPSLFAPQSIARFLAAVRARVPTSPQLEVTLEANPGTIEHGAFAGYREAGVTRVSLGVQSFDDHQLKVLGRIHGPQHVRDAVKEIQAAGIKNFNLDLMYGLPSQAVDAALEDLGLAIELRPTHLSHYQLALEPGTPFYHRPPSLPDEDTIWEMQTRCQELIAQHGFQQYEVSAYAAPGFECRHNLNYWTYGDYLGLGAGAHGKYTDAALNEIVRTERVRQPRQYLAQGQPSDRLTSRRVAQREIPFEFMLNALRLTRPFSVELFNSRTGLEISAIEGPLARALELELLVAHAPGSWQVTDRGFQYLNDLQALFLPSQIERSETGMTRVTSGL